MITIISFGKLKNKAIKSLEDELVKRLQRFAFAKTQFIEWKDDSVQNEMKTIEEFIASKQGNTSVEKIYLLDEKGKKINSKEFKLILEKSFDEGRETIFIIGGAEGFPDEWKKEIISKNHSVELLQLSPLTFTHEMARLILVEQIYRATTMKANIPYHKE